MFCYLPSNNVIGGLIGKLAGVKQIFGGIRGSKIKSSKMKMLLQKIVCNRISDKFIANSGAARDNYINYGYRPSKILVVPNMIDVDAIEERSRSGRKKMPIKVLSVGRFVDEKDYDTALKAIELLKEQAESGKLEFIIVGYGPLKVDIIKEIKKKGLEKYVEIIDGQKPGIVERFLQNSDIFLITSKHEGMPNSVMEAMLHGLPVVGTNAGDIGKLVVSGKNGFLCRIGDYRDISRNLLRLIKSEKLREEMGIESYYILKKHFSLQKIGVIYIELLKSFEREQSAIVT